MSLPESWPKGTIFVRIGEGCTLDRSVSLEFKKAWLAGQQIPIQYMQTKDPDILSRPPGAFIGIFAQTLCIVVSGDNASEIIDLVESMSQHFGLTGKVIRGARDGYPSLICFGSWERWTPRYTNDMLRDQGYLTEIVDFTVNEKENLLKYLYK